MNDDELAKFRGLAKTEFPDLPSDLREPLHSLQADTSYLIGRVQSDSSVGGMVANSIKSCLSHIEEAAYRLNAKAHAPSDLMREVRAFLEAIATNDPDDGVADGATCAMAWQRDAVALLSKLGEA